MYDEPVRARLQAALPAAMKTRDGPAVAALRSVLAALDNAQAVDGGAFHLAQAGHERLAGTVGELGTAEVPRAPLSEAQARAIVAREAEERRAAALDYDRHSEAQHASRLRTEADLLATFLT